MESFQGIKLRGCCFAEITNMFFKNSLQSIVTPSRLTENSEVIQRPLRLICIEDLSCLVFLEMMAFSLSGLIIIELVWNQSIAKFDFEFLYLI